MLVSSALLIHHDDKNQDHVVVNQHEVMRQDGRLIIGAGRSLNDTDIHALGAVLRDEKRDRAQSLFGRQFLRIGAKELVWVKPASIEEVSYDGRYETLPHPTLIFKVIGGALSVAAVKTKQVHQETKLYRAPYGNCSTFGRLCLGHKNNLPKDMSVDDVDYVERLFFESEFCELHCSGVKGVHKWEDQKAFFDSLIGRKRFKTPGWVEMNTNMLSWVGDQC